MIQCDGGREGESARAGGAERLNALLPVVLRWAEGTERWMEEEEDLREHVRV